MKLLVGGYSADGGGRAEGIGLLASDADSARDLTFRGVVADASSPSWVAHHPQHDVLYAALEPAGAVQAFAQVGQDEWRAWGDPVRVGAAPCHLLVGRERMMVACWVGGTIEQIGLAPDGSLREAVAADAASDPYPGYVSDERVAHAHQSIVVAPGLVASTDMGFDLVRFWRTGIGAPKLVQEVRMPRGSGPRHGFVHPSGNLIIVTELSREAFVLGPDSTGTWRVIGGTSLGATLEGDTAAEIAPSRDGAFVYAGVRGSNTVSVLRVTANADALEQVALVDAGVDWPRHHLVTDGALLVAGERSHEVAVLPLDARGIPGRRTHVTEVPSPTCLVIAE